MQRFLPLTKNAQRLQNQKSLSVFIFILLNLFSYKAHSTHIVGGDMSYQCLGYGDYQFIMKMYRNCNSQAQGNFPAPATMTVYRENDNGSYDIFRNEDVFLIQSASEIPLPEIPCLEPPDDVCVQEGEYRLGINLPLSNRSYVVVFQRCCRNGSISNILEPGDVGTTFTIEVTPEAQASCNRSPIFNTFPPTVICVNEPMSVDQSASDAEGDQLVYEFCAPLKGGGKAGTQDDPNGDPAGCDGFRPDPACPPPFEPVDYIVPTYSASQPMAGAPLVSINPITGEITGIPNTIGQFVVGVCVKEFRNGTLLSVSQRDFQFNVEQCDPFIEPLILADEVLDDNTFVINSCGDSTVAIVNQSTTQQNIDNFLWEFDIDGNMVAYDVWSPTLMLPDTGTYEGFLYLDPGSQCGDTGRVLINYFPDAQANFRVQFDSCVAGDVAFVDDSQIENIIIEDWTWNLGNGTLSTEQNPVVKYDNVGSYNVSLEILNEFGCINTIQKTVDWFPAPELIVVEPSTFVGCPPANIFFNNLTDPIDNSYQIEWLFGDTTTSTDFSPTHIYDEVGSYTIDVKVTSPLGCVTTRTFQNWINITPEPIADFETAPDEIDNFNPTVEFIDSSLFADSWFWNFNDESNAYIQNPSHIFRDTGLQRVELIVTHPNGCADTTSRIVDVVPKVTYYLPNAFSPNGDGINDTYKGKGYLVGLKDFNLEIWNRWGERIYQTNDPSEGWNGTKNNNGKLTPNGTYQCFVQYTEPRGERKELHTHLTLIR